MGEPKKLEHHDIRWVTVREMDELDFCPADQVFVNEIRRRNRG
jgi:8-oxo-dGTP diphosphatase